MHICKEHGRISEFLHHSLMMSKDKMEVTEKILSLTLEIIFLLTGEDFVLRKKQKAQSTDDCQLCLSEGSTKDQSPCEERPCQSPVHEETTEEETPEPDETTHSTTQEVPVRCEDVAVFFSMEEWEYMEGHKERYKDVVSESHPSPAPAGCDRVNAVDKEKELQDIQVDPTATISDAPVSGGRIPTKPPESCTSPLTSQECMEEDIRILRQECQASPGDRMSPDRYEEEDVLVEISSGDPSPINSPAISGSPVCIEEDSGMIPQEFQDETGDALTNWCTEGPDPSEMCPPTSWEVQPDSPHLLIPVHHKNGVNPSNPEGGISSDSPPIVVMIKTKTVLNEVTTLKCTTDQPCLFWQKPQADDSSSSLMEYTGGAVSLPPALETPAVHKCLQCGRSFQSDTDLISHQRTHEKTFQCALCQQSFLDKSSLVVHQWTFHIQEPKTGDAQAKQRERPFSCSECGNSFLNKSSLVKHQRIHTGAFACPDCGKCLSDKTGLVRHRRTHTGEKPYACSDCGRRFTRKCHLMTHQSAHTSKDLFESFPCSDCGKCFSVKSVLEAHQAFHKRHKDLVQSDTTAQEQ